MHCPDCYSQRLVKNGFNALDKQMYLCKECGRQFVLDPAKTAISDEKKKLRLLLGFEDMLPQVVQSTRDGSRQAQNTASLVM